MTPATGSRQSSFQGDMVTFHLLPEAGKGTEGWIARLRTTIGRGASIRSELFTAFEENRDPGVSVWRDVPMPADEDGGWTLTLPLSEVGYFEAKAYAISPEGYQVWPEGGNFGVSVHPNEYRTRNVIYCAFTRLFGKSKELEFARNEEREARDRLLDEAGYTVIPPSGTLRDLKRQVPHIFRDLGCRVLHLLPVHPTPTTFARMGRYGSPYAALDLTAIDPALVEFDQRTTGVDQFCELTRAVHREGGSVFLDLVINHTGWGSKLQETHPEWFKRNPDGTFQSPGAWGVTWGDLVELDHHWKECWETLAQVFLTWMRRGVNGFRCDAGYMIPEPVWRYTIARVREYFPNAIFLLEGLGGPLETTENLLSVGGMNWAYSELFQNYSPQELHHYLKYSHGQSQKVGYYIHYSETHDNNRLAASGPEPEINGSRWSRMRNMLSALTSEGGGFGYTSGVEWLAQEKINVHGCSGMRWGAEDNLVAELGQVSRVLAGHPVFFDAATIRTLSGPDSMVYVIRRDSADGKYSGLVAVNTDVTKMQIWHGAPADLGFLGEEPREWLGLKEEDESPEWEIVEGQFRLTLPPGAAVFLSPISDGVDLARTGEEYRRRRAVFSWALEVASEHWTPEVIGALDWSLLSNEILKDPLKFLGALGSAALKKEAPGLLEYRADQPIQGYPPVVLWRLEDARKVTPAPFRHWLVIEHDQPFQWELRPCSSGSLETLTAGRGPGGVRFGESIWMGENRYWSAIWTGELQPGEWTLALSMLVGSDTEEVRSAKLLICPESWTPSKWDPFSSSRRPSLEEPKVLLTNQRGGMARLGVAPGHVNSKYDCLLGANLHSEFPVDRHVLVKRARIWVNADGFISELNLRQIKDFDSGPPARWEFEVSAGGGRRVKIEMLAGMIPDKNATVLQWSWLGVEGESDLFPSVTCNMEAQGADRMLSHKSPFQIGLIIRLDLEDRNFHWETKRNGAAEAHFAGAILPIECDGGLSGFRFTPAADRRLKAEVDQGQYRPGPEWSEGLDHAVEASRGQTGHGDAYSPGWFDIPLSLCESSSMLISAEASECDQSTNWQEVRQVWDALRSRRDVLLKKAGISDDKDLAGKLARAIDAFVVKRDAGKTVIAGYPWFLDWGRDSLICARGLIAAGWVDETRELIQIFGRFEENGTLPNTIHGDDLSNRNTTDAPLWFGVVCEEWLEKTGDWAFLDQDIPGGEDKTLKDTLRSIALGYLKGAPNGIRVDHASGLVWSPSHFTWMDTNYPAGTPREGYPIEIQAMWERLLRFLDRIDHEGPGAVGDQEAMSWGGWADRVRSSVEERYWLETKGWYSDVLHAGPGVAADHAIVDQALRSNFLLGITLGISPAGERSQSAVEAARAGLVIPGALRSLAPGRVEPPLEIRTPSGRLLNDPFQPYWGRYEGDEDTRRKPAYHNGTAWTWTFPVFCEALAMAWPDDPAALAAAKNYLATMGPLLETGCIGQIPEVIDGDAPHCQRGCDAQAWGVTEAYRVWKSFGKIK